ncbi:MAG: rRNA maturation RNase YbeY [Chloroflexota bacterium]
MSGPLIVTLNADLPEEWQEVVNLDSLLAVAESVLHAEQRGGVVEVELLLVSDAAIHELNEQYRGVDAPTDVLSFPLQDEGAADTPFVAPPDGVQRLGDIVISVPRAVAQAGEYGHSAEREVAYLFAHGMLHLLGFDHEEESARQEMRVREEAALEAVGLSR